MTSAAASLPYREDAQYPGAPIKRIAREKQYPIWPIVVVIYLTLLPREIHLRIGDIYIFADRIGLMLTLPWVFRCLTQKVIKFVLPDWLILFAGFWSVVSMVHAYGWGRGLFSGGSYAFDSIAGYYLARVSFRSLNDVRRALIVVAPIFFLCALSVMLESISHHLFVRPAFQAVFGNIENLQGVVGTTGRAELNYHDIRAGLLRGYGPWPHPILAGLHLATLLPIYFLSGIRGWPRITAILAALMAIFTVSSAAAATLVGGIFLLFYNYLTKVVPQLSWKLFFYGLLVVLGTVQAVSQSGAVGLIIRFASFDPQTGFYRQLIWQYGTLTVSHHPLFGIGYEDYEHLSWMTTSVDNHWLLWAIRYGLPAALSLFGACIVTIVALGRSIVSSTVKSDTQFYRGILMSLALMVLMMFTVAIQGGTLTWFTILLGGCVGCAQRGFDITRPGVMRINPRSA